MQVYGIVASKLVKLFLFLKSTGLASMLGNFELPSQCFEAKKMTPFPAIEICTTIHLNKLEVLRVYCRCCMPLTQGDELQTCNVCNERFHAACQLNAEKHWMDEGGDTKVWFCNECWKLVEKKGFAITGIKSIIDFK